jgi:hypothetical protein
MHFVYMLAYVAMVLGLKLVMLALESINYLYN